MSTPGQEGRSAGRGIVLVTLSASASVAIAVIIFRLLSKQVSSAHSLLLGATLFPQISVFAVAFARLCLLAALPALPPLRTRPVVGVVPVVVPVILRNPADVIAIGTCIDNNLLHLGGRPLVFLVDLADAPHRSSDDDALFPSLAQQQLRRRSLCDGVFLLFRRRHFDPVDHVWRGWERKRGKIVEFCQMVTGSEHTSFVDPLPSSLRDAPAFLTIDIDTKLVGGTLEELAHDNDWSAIVCPRIDLVCSATPSLFQRLLVVPFRTPPIAGPSPNQKILGYDLFHGKGLVFPRRFLNGIAGHIPERSLLSHDHLEALLCGAVLRHVASVDEVVPYSRRQWARRQERWIRGDFQTLRWFFGGRLPMTKRFHLFETTITHLCVVGSFTSAMAFLLIAPPATAVAGAAFSIIAVKPAFFVSCMTILYEGFTSGASFDRATSSVLKLQSREGFGWLRAVMFLPQDAFLTTRAVMQAVWRMSFTGRNMLAWDTRPARLSRIPLVVATAMAMVSAAMLVLGSDVRVHFAGGLILLWSVTAAIFDYSSRDEAC